MSKMALVAGIICLFATIVILIFADGARRWYSGLFFAVIGAVMFVNAARWRRLADKKQP